MKTGETYGTLFNEAGCLLLTAIQGYLRDLLSGEEKERVERHLAACPLCREAVEGFRQIPAPERQEMIVDQLKAELYHDLIQEKEDHYVAASQVLMDKSVPYAGAEPFRSAVHQGRKKIPVWTLYVAAASVLLIAGYVAFFLPRPSQTMLTTSESMPPSPSETILPAEPEKDTARPELAVADRKTETKRKETGLRHPEEPKEEKTGEDIAQTAAEPPEMAVAGLQVTVPMAMDTIIIRLAEEEQAGEAGIDKVAEDAEMMKKEESPRSKAAGALTGMNTQSAFDQATPPDSVALFRQTGYKDFTDYINRNLTYPSRARRQGIEGTVMVRFVVDGHGKVRDVTISGSAHPLLDEEARRVIEKSPDWVPAYKKDQPVETILTCPVTFSLK